MLGCELPGEAWKLRGRIGYLGHEPLLYRDLTGRENLRFHARLHGIDGERGRGADRASCSTASGWSGAPTSGSPSSPPGCASGSRSAAASCTSRELLLLDEPDSHLDAEGRELARALIGPGAGRTRVSSPTTPSAACRRPTACWSCAAADRRDGRRRARWPRGGALARARA